MPRRISRRSSARQRRGDGLATQEPVAGRHQFVDRSGPSSRAAHSGGRLAQPVRRARPSSSQLRLETRAQTVDGVGSRRTVVADRVERGGHDRAGKRKSFEGECAQASGERRPRANGRADHAAIINAEEGARTSEGAGTISARARQPRTPRYPRLDGRQPSAQPPVHAQRRPSWESSECQDASRARQPRRC